MNSSHNSHPAPDSHHSRLPKPLEEKPLAWPWRRMLRYDALGSTQQLAWRMAQLGREMRGVVIWAERQRQGRGRWNRSWISERGGLYATATLPFGLTLAPAEAGWITLSAALSCAELLRERLGLPAEVKWPNDVLIAGRKVAGILGEIKKLKTSGQEIILIGLGLNWLNDVQAAAREAAFSAASLGEFRHDLTLAGRRGFLLAWLARLNEWHGRLLNDATAGSHLLWSALEAILWKKGEQVRLRDTEKGLIPGILLGLGPGGAARLQTSGGQEILAYCGHHE